MKKRQRIISIVLSIMLLCNQSYISVLATDTDNNLFGKTKESEIRSGSCIRTKEEVLEWMKSQVGQSLNVDGSDGAQCVDLIVAYYDYLGVPRSSGNAVDYIWNQKPEQWERIENAIPQPGDILIYTGGDEGNGHVALYESDYSTYHQNFDNNRTVQRVTETVYNGFRTPYWGVLRPNFPTYWYDNLTPANIGDEVYATLIKSDCQAILGVENNNVQIVNDYGDGDVSKIWRFVRQSDGFYILYNCKDDQVLDVQEAKDADGTNVGVFTSNENNCQKWYIYDYGNGEYVLRPKLFRRALTVKDNGNKKGTNVEINSYNNESSQKFSLRIFPKAGASQLTVQAGNSRSNTRLSWTKGNGANKYNIRIQKGAPGNVTFYKDVWGVEQLSYDIILPQGYYEAYVDSCNDYSYSSSNRVKFTVETDYNLAKCNLNLESTQYLYTGKEIIPKFVVKNCGEVLVEGRDFVVSYTNNIKLGTATMLVKGIGNYFGELKGSFKIVKEIDNDPPVIKNKYVVVTNVSEQGFDLSFDVEDNIGVAQVYANVYIQGQTEADAKKIVGKVDGTKATIKVLTSSFDGFDGNYYVTCYALDKVGNVTSVETIPGRTITLYDVLVMYMGTYEVTKDDVPLRDAPYASVNGKNTKVDVADKGEKFTIVGVYANDHNNIWFKLKEGLWVYGENVKKVFNFFDLIEYITQFSNKEVYYMDKQVVLHGGGGHPFNLIKTTDSQKLSDGSYANIPVTSSSFLSEEGEWNGNVFKPSIESYNVNFDGNGGRVSWKNKKVYQGREFGSLPTVQKSRYALAGWFTEAEGGTEITPDTICDLSGDITLYAHWVENIQVSGECGDNLTFKLCEGVLEIKGSGDMYDNPAWDKYSNGIAVIHMDSGVTSIGSYAFDNCIYLESINIPDGVTKIGNNSFDGCISLESIAIPDSVRRAGSRAFAGCKVLTKVTMPVDMEYYSATYSIQSTFQDTENIKEIVYTKGQTGEMSEKDNAETGPRYWGESAEGNSRSSLEKVSFEEGVTDIGNYAFRECSVLKEVEIPETVTKIGDYAFYNCNSITMNGLPEHIEEVGDYGFADSNLSGKINTVWKMGKGSFSGSKITYIEFGDKVSEIPLAVCALCENLEEAKIADSVRKTNERAFKGCTALSKLTMPVDMEYYSIGNAGFTWSTFCDTKNIKEIVYTKGQTGKMIDKVGSETELPFYGQSAEGQSRGSLEKVSFEEGVTDIGNYAFRECSVLDKVLVPKSVAQIGKDTFIKTPTTLKFYGEKDSLAETYAQDNDKKFIPLKYPIITPNDETVVQGSSKQFEAKVYEDLDNYSKDVIWSVEGNKSDKTNISETGKLTVSANESATKLTVKAEANSEVASVEVKIEKNSFTDVSQGDWYYDAVMYVSGKKLMGGMTSTTFGPSVSLTRAQFATILYQVAGQPEISYSAKFQDVPKGQWYTNGVLWANNIGVVGGYNNGLFGPNNNITREQMALMMYNYAQYKGYDVSKKTDISSFADVSKVSSYAQEAMKWAVENKIISGKSGNKLDPQGKATRAECATIIMQFIEQYEK